MDIIALVILVVIRLLLSATILWLAMKLTGVDGRFAALIAIAGIAAICGLVPLVGWLVGLVVMLVLITKWTTAELWPDAILMVLVSWVISFFASLALVGYLA